VGLIQSTKAPDRLLNHASSGVRVIKKEKEKEKKKKEKKKIRRRKDPTGLE